MPIRKRDPIVPEVQAPLEEFAYYYPDPYWMLGEGGWIKSLLLFFDGVAVLLPRYMKGREILADPELAEPLQGLGLMKILEPEWFVDDVLSERLAEHMVELIANDAFPPAKGTRSSFAELSMSRMGYAELSMSRMGVSHRGVFEMIHDDLKSRGLALDTEDGVSIPLRRDVRLTYLMLLAQEAREAGRRHGFDLHPTTNGQSARRSVRSFLENKAMPSRQDVIAFDLATASVDLADVPLADVLGFRAQYNDEHRRYMANLRDFVATASTGDANDRARLINDRQAELNEEARGLRRLALVEFKKAKNAASFGLGLTGAAWVLATGNPVGAGLTGLGATLSLLPSRPTGSAYSYIFRAHRKLR